ncbi:Uncharacterized protein YjbI, contains pentapeptide repeats [Poseidonocella pacifica]|uniref:Uncharacterized protein YjbI, contains pentapeptide repeats n=1 Tax=Poseidonocella pacifica TaxID=871651 RepID=A0A1I0VNE4_9RHOB|nr:pentapeptide repeat-containing protein [Poseidonocella pacifica]SFA77831.1 Uncharacterized protein YjbI, contains pentapeptide repeats [Poseidonocella pacifica]
MPEIPDRLAQSLGDWLDQLAEEKRRSLAPTPKKGFWARLNIDRATKMIGVVVTVGGLFGAVITFLLTEHEKTRLARTELEQNLRETIATFAPALSDPERRTSAALAIGTLQAQESVPLLTAHLKEAIRVEQRALTTLRNSLENLEGSITPETDLLSLRQVLDRDSLTILGFDDPAKSALLVSEKEGEDLVRLDIARRESGQFVSALVNALALAPGGNGIRELVWLNRGAADPAHGADPATIRQLTSPALWSYATGPFLEKPVILDGITITGIDFSYQDTTKAKLSGITLETLSACRGDIALADLSYSDLRDISLIDGTATAADFRHARLVNVRFLGTNMRNTRFDDEIGSSSSSTLGKFFDQRVSSAPTALNYVAFDTVSLAEASFAGATLNTTIFYGSDLSNADFTGAQFGRAKEQIPEAWPYPVGGNAFDPSGIEENAWEFGPIVRGANFAGATGLTAEDRTYLCRFGAENVPDGCDGIDPAQDAERPKNAHRRFSMHTGGRC